ncbi:MAG: hypothetical protein ACK526_23525 [Planctomyces sp.]|jgi:hypothetical protein
MVFSRISTGTLILVAALAAAVNCEEAAAGGPRQYYSEWVKRPNQSYHYRHYYFKPSASYSGYRHHYVVYHPQKPKHLYFYNPYTKTYWGRCPLGTNGAPKYSQLAEKDRRSVIRQIPETAFPEPSEPPVIPEATDNEKLDLPPDDLPSDVFPSSTTPGIAAPTAAPAPPASE